MAFAAGSLDMYQQHIELLLSPAHVQAEIQVLAYFWPRFEPWFEQQRTGLAQFVTDAEQLTAELNINQLLTAMRVFYHSDLPEDLLLPVYLIAHPLAQAKTSAFAFGQYSLIEVLQGERAADRVAVVIHEIAHFYHESAPLKNHIESMNFFTGPDSETGKVGYYLFNEAMATAIGNGLLEQRIKDGAYFDKYLAYPLSFYNDPAIDASAKAAMTLVKQQIESNQRIDAEFLEALDEIWAVALKDLKDNPKQRLRHVGMVNLSSHGNGLIDQLFNLIQPSSAQVIDSESTDAGALTSEDFLINRYPELDVLILADTWQQLAPLKLSGLDVNQPNQQGFQILKNQHGGMRVLVVGDSTDFMVDAVADLLKQASFQPVAN